MAASLDDYKVSVVIPTLNDGEDLDRALGSLSRQTLSHEVIVVDGYSTDGTVDVAKRHGADVVFEEIGTRGGACNVGAERASGNVVVFTDADAYFPGDWLERIVEKFEATGADVVGGEDVMKDGSRFEKALFAIDLDREEPVDGEAWRRVRGCNSAYRRELLLENPFDPELKSIEETELHYRLHRNGASFSFDTDIEVFHRRRQGLRALFKQLRRNGRGRAQVVKKHPGILDAHHDYAPLGLFAVFLAGLLLAPLDPRGAILPVAVLGLLSIAAPLKVSISSGSIGAFPLLTVIYPVRWFAWCVGYIEELLGVAR